MATNPAEKNTIVWVEDDLDFSIPNRLAIPGDTNLITVGNYPDLLVRYGEMLRDGQDTEEEVDNLESLAARLLAHDLATLLSRTSLLTNLGALVTDHLRDQPQQYIMAIIAVIRQLNPTATIIEVSGAEEAIFKPDIFVPKPFTVGLGEAFRDAPNTREAKLEALKTYITHDGLVLARTVAATNDQTLGGTKEDYLEEIEMRFYRELEAILGFIFPTKPVSPENFLANLKYIPIEDFREILHNLFNNIGWMQEHGFKEPSILSYARLKKQVSSLFP